MKLGQILTTCIQMMREFNENSNFKAIATEMENLIAFLLHSSTEVTTTEEWGDLEASYMFIVEQVTYFLATTDDNAFTDKEQFKKDMNKALGKMIPILNELDKNGIQKKKVIREEVIEKEVTKEDTKVTLIKKATQKATKWYNKLKKGLSMNLQKILALKEGLMTIKLNAKEVASYYDLSPVRVRNHPYKADLTNALKIKVLFEELTTIIVYKEWGESKAKREQLLSNGTFNRVNITDRSKEPVDFKKLSLSEKDESILKKSGILWIKKDGRI